MKAEFLLTTRSRGQQQKAGTIHVDPKTGSVSASATPGHRITMQRIASEPIYVNDRFVSPAEEPFEWFNGLTTQYNGSYLRARIIPEPFEEQEHWVTLPGGKHVLIGGKSPAVKEALPKLPKMADVDKESFKKLYESDPEFRDFANAVHAFTNGQNKAITKAAEAYVKEGESGLAKIISEPPFNEKSFDVTGERPVYSGAGEFEEHPALTGVSREDVLRWGLVLNHAIANAPEEEKTVYRGASAAHPIEDFENLKPGSEFQLAGPRSFSHELKIANSFIDEGNDNKYMFVLEGKSKGINARALSVFKGENEFITSGKFKVKSIEEHQKIPGPYEHSNVKIFHLEQTGVF